MDVWDGVFYFYNQSITHVVVTVLLCRLIYVANKKLTRRDAEEVLKQTLCCTLLVEGLVPNTQAPEVGEFFETQWGDVAKVMLL